MSAKRSARARQKGEGQARPQPAGAIASAEPAPKRRDAERATPPATGDGAPRRTKTPNLPDWHWRSFPVFAAFVAGVLVDSLINPASSDPALALRLLAIFGVGYAVVHVVVTNVIVARRIRRYEQAQAASGAPPPPAEDDDEDEWEEEVVYPDEAADK